MLREKGRKEGRKEILLMRATTKVDWHVNVWSEQISGPQIYQGKQWCTCLQGADHLPIQVGP